MSKSIKELLARKAGSPLIDQADGDFSIQSVNAAFIPGAGLLSVFGDGDDNSITASRDAAGNILVNGGAVGILGGTPTVANTATIQMFGLRGNDTLALDETNGALPRAMLFGGAGDDTLTGGSGGDQLFGQSDNDTLNGRGGFDSLFGGAGNDVLTGGDGDDQMFGQGGNDRMIWNPGDDSDLMEGGSGDDTAEVNGGNGAEIFTATANGARVRFDRLDPAPFFLDIGTTENLVVNMNGGNDSFSATGPLAALIKLTVDGGAGNDTILGSNGSDVLLGGEGDDFIDGQQGDDIAFLGAGDDDFQWDPGDGSDVVEGQDGTDTMLFNGSAGDEDFSASANGERVTFFRNLGNINMNLNDVERIELNAFGGVDKVVVNDLSGTDVTEVDIDLAGTLGGTAGDGAVDTVRVNGTNGDDTVKVLASGTSATVEGLSAAVKIANLEPTDELVVSGAAGDDTIDASAAVAGVMKLTIDGGAGDDTILGSRGADELLGGDDDDFVDGQQGNDVAFLGAGDDEFQWDPGDGSDVVEGEDGTDTLLFNGSGGDENFIASANGERATFFRNLGNINMDLNEVERIELNALGGVDKVVVNDLSGTDVTEVAIDLAGTIGGSAGDGVADMVEINATGDDDIAFVVQSGTSVSVLGLAAQVTVDHFDATGDLLAINGGDGDDIISAASVSAGSIGLRLDGGAGDDILLGGAGDDFLDGGDGDDLLIGGGGSDTFLNGETTIQDFVAGAGTEDRIDLRGIAGATDFDAVMAHAQDVDGGVVLDLGNGAEMTLMGVSVAALHADDFLL